MMSTAGGGTPGWKSRWRRSRPSRRPGGDESEGLEVIDSDGNSVHAVPSDVARGARYLLARLQLNDVAGLPRRLGLTSALQGEGVTFIARSLGAVVAHDLGRRTCVVDLNWWSAADEDVLAPRRGIADVVSGDVALDDVLVSTNDPQMVLLPAGRVEPRDRPVIAKHPRLDEVLDDVAMRFDHLVIELPAVHVSSDTLTLVRVCDAFALVVRHGTTPDDIVRSALQELSGAVSLGVVLNRASSRVPQRIARLLAT